MLHELRRRVTAVVLSELADPAPDGARRVRQDMVWQPPSWPEGNGGRASAPTGPPPVGGTADHAEFGVFRTPWMKTRQVLLEDRRGVEPADNVAKALLEDLAGVLVFGLDEGLGLRRSNGGGLSGAQDQQVLLAGDLDDPDCPLDPLVVGASFQRPGEAFYSGLDRLVGPPDQLVLDVGTAQPLPQDGRFDRNPFLFAAACRPFIVAPAIRLRRDLLARSCLNCAVTSSAATPAPRSAK